MSWLETLARPDILALKSYEHASWEPGLARLHANELPWRAAGDESVEGLNRYPEPQPKALRERLAEIYQVRPRSLLLGRGSDEMIDLLMRAFCRAGQDAVVICPPTFGMYRVAAQVQGAEVIPVPLRYEEGFALDADAVLQTCEERPEVKLVFLCSPNNPTGQLLDADAVRRVGEGLAGRALLVVDEAYIEFADAESLASEVDRLPQLAILRTLSKAHGLAGARIGSLIADPEVIHLLTKLVAPYGVPQLVVEAALEMLSGAHLRMVGARIGRIRLERERVRSALAQFPQVSQVYPSDANFLLARFTDAGDALARARRAGLLVRDARGYPGLADALRITIGAPVQNDQLLKAWA